MNLEILRYKSGSNATLGSLFVRNADGGREWLAYTLEDEHRDKKVKHETRIPAGHYRMAIRDDGGMNTGYSKRYDFHRGMLWIREKFNGVEWRSDWGFTYVYIHIGNTEADTSGCPLVGLSQNGTAMTVGRSRDAYKKIYPVVADSIENGSVYLDVTDYA